MNEIPSTHPQVVIDLTEYGKAGEIVLSSPDVARYEAFQNTLFTKILSKKDFVMLQKNEKTNEEVMFDAYKNHSGTVSILQLLSYIEKAPFHINDYWEKPELDGKAFTDFVGRDLKLYNRIKDEVNRLGVNDPFLL